MGSTSRPSTAPKGRPNPRAEAKRAAERRQRIVMVAAGIGVLLIAIVIAVLSAGESGSALSTSDVARDVQVRGDALPVLEGDPAADPAVGDAAPVVRGEDFDGTPVEIGAPGRAQLVTFMASWCPACQQELPEVTAWIEDGRLPAEVDLIAVATSLDAGRPNWPPQDWFEEVGFPGPVLVDDTRSTVASTYGLPATPYWVAIDADGRIVARNAGMIPMAQLDALAQTLAAG